MSEPLTEERLSKLEDVVSRMRVVEVDDGWNSWGDGEIPVYRHTYENYRDLIAEVRKLRAALAGVVELFKTQRAVCLVPEDFNGTNDPLDRVAAAEAALAREGGGRG